MLFTACLQNTSMRQHEQRPFLTDLAPLHTYLTYLMTFHIACIGYSFKAAGERRP
jgi:hypothetical protein